MQYTLDRLLGDAEPAPMQQWITATTQRYAWWIESELGRSAHIAGDEFTAADILMPQTVDFMRTLAGVKDLALSWPNCDAYLARIAARPAYQRARKRAAA